MEATVKADKVLIGKVPGYAIVEIRDFPTLNDLQDYGFSQRTYVYQCQGVDCPENIELHLMRNPCCRSVDEILKIGDRYSVEVFNELVGKIGEIMADWYALKHMTDMEAEKHVGERLFMFRDPYEGI